MYLNFQAKIFANNFRHQCFFTVMTELFLVHITGTQLINIQIILQNFETSLIWNLIVQTMQQFKAKFIAAL